MADIDREALRALLAAARDAEPNAEGARAVTRLRDAAEAALPGLLDALDEARRDLEAQRQKVRDVSQLVAEAREERDALRAWGLRVLGVVEWAADYAAHESEDMPPVSGALLARWAANGRALLGEEG